MSEQTLYQWTKTFAGMLVAQPRRLRQLDEDKRKFQTLMPDLSLGRQIIQRIEGLASIARSAHLVSAGEQHTKQDDAIAINKTISEIASHYTVHT